MAGAEFRTVLGLDLKGGIRVTLEAEPESDEAITATDLETARAIIERRVAGIGVNEPLVRTETAGDGSQRIVVEVPGVDDPDQVRRLVGSTGQLEFIDPQGYVDAQGQGLQDGQDISGLIEDGTVGVLFDGGEIDVSSVAPAVDGNLIGVQFTLSDEASDIWCDFTSANVDRPGPIALDGEVITVPNINERHLRWPDDHHRGRAESGQRGGADRALQHPALRRAADLTDRAGRRDRAPDARSRLPRAGAARRRRGPDRSSSSS